MQAVDRRLQLALCTAGSAAHSLHMKPLWAWPYQRLIYRARQRSQLQASTRTFNTGFQTFRKALENLPIKECINDVVEKLQTHNSLVLQAPPGAGKTTAVPLKLLEARDPAYLPRSKRIVMLEPRRVAAKAAARRMAALLGEEVGETVGYRVKLESKVSPATRIEVVTDGILLQRLQFDPYLRGVGVVVFDEFHERNLNSDLCLTLCLDGQRTRRDDLRQLPTGFHPNAGFW